jgi:hypothetical protein
VTGTEIEDEAENRDGGWRREVKKGTKRVDGDEDGRRPSLPGMVCLRANEDDSLRRWQEQWKGKSISTQWASFADIHGMMEAVILLV